MLATLALALSPAWLARQEKSGEEHPPRREPSAKAEAHKTWSWTAANGLRYAWVLPQGYDPAKPRHLVVICHGTGLDYRWGHWNHKPGEFRPDDIVVSVDGPSEGPGESRLFLGEKDDADAMAEFLAELRRAFAVDRVFLYGHSQGGFFVVYYAGLHPDTVDGVVAHASGAWNWSRTDGGVQRVPIVFLHGTADPVVPYFQSPGSCAVYVEKGCKFARLRRMSGYNHWPNGVRSSECIDWCLGMRTDDPEAAMAAARRIAAPKPKDGYEYETPPPLGLAREVLARFEKGATVPLKSVPSRLSQEAKELAKRIDAHTAEQIKALDAPKGKCRDWPLAGSAWAGHLAALSVDFAGVPVLEKYLEQIEWDEARAEHGRAAEPLWKAWKAEPRDEALVYSTVLQALPKCFLDEDLPLDLIEKMEEWNGRAGKFGLPKAVLEQWQNFRDWRAAWKDGFEAYLAASNRWRASWK